MDEEWGTSGLQGGRDLVADSRAGLEKIHQGGRKMNRMTVRLSQTKGGLRGGPEAIKARIMALDTKVLSKMDVGEFWLLRESADAEGRRKLDYLLRRMEIEGFARVVVREELQRFADGSSAFRAKHKS
jgi:hypothetical protein